MLVNGQNIEIETTSILEILGHFELNPDQIAVERNGEILPRSLWSEVQLAAGDRIELIRFVGGG